MENKAFIISTSVLSAIWIALISASLLGDSIRAQFNTMCSASRISLMMEHNSEDEDRVRLNGINAALIEPETRTEIIPY